MKKFLIIENQAVVIAGIKAFLLLEYPNSSIYSAYPNNIGKEFQLDSYDCIILGMNPIISDNDSLIQNILIHQKDAKILIFSNDVKTIFAKHYLRVGAKGFISKYTSQEEFLTAINTILSNKVYLSDDIKYELTNELVESKNEGKVETLSKREIEVTTMLAKGMSNSEISNVMHLHSSSVGTYKARIFEKLHIRNIIELRQFAQLHNIING